MTRGRTTNPYLRSGSLLLKRIRWDLKTESYRSRSRLRTKLNRHEGEKAVILCNGPSLLKSDLQALHDSNIATFGLNKINLLYDRTDLRPNFIVAVNPFVIEQNKEFFNQTNAELFLDSYGYTMGCAARSNVCFLHSTNMPGEFARDCSISIFQGFTVTYVAMQLAFHMGFHKLTVIGCDHNFSATGPANTTVKADGKDRNHFDPNYFSTEYPGNFLIFFRVKWPIKSRIKITWIMVDSFITPQQVENSKYFLALIWLSSFNLRKYVEATAVYLSASLLAKFIPFLLLPVFTRLLSESDYGVLGIFGTLVAIGSVFIGLRPDIYIIRVYNELDQRVYSELKLAFMVMIRLPRRRISLAYC